MRQNALNGITMYSALARFCGLASVRMAWISSSMMQCMNKEDELSDINALVKYFFARLLMSPVFFYPSPSFNSFSTSFKINSLQYSRMIAL